MNILSLEDYTSAAVNFARSTDAWSYLQVGQWYTTEGLIDGSTPDDEVCDGVYNSADNQHGGLGVSWAFKMDEEEVKRQAPQRYVDAIRNEIENLRDWAEDDPDYYQPTIYALESALARFQR